MLEAGQNRPSFQRICSKRREPVRIRVPLNARENAKPQYIEVRPRLSVRFGESRIAGLFLVGLKLLSRQIIALAIVI
jgi:hypothetical protein